MDKKKTTADGILDRLEMRFGPHPGLRNRLRPILSRILNCGASSDQRTALLRLVVEAYTYQVKVRNTLDDLRGKLRLRLNEPFGKTLGIEPPNVGS